MDGLAVARVLHVLDVVVWIGGVSIVTTAVLPAVRRSEFGANWLAAFQAIERRFAWQARVAIVIVGLTGLYMIVQADMWKLSAMNAHSSERSSPLTRRWRKGDSTPRSPQRGALLRTDFFQPSRSGNRVDSSRCLELARASP